MMKLQRRSRQISLASIFICVFSPQVQAGIWDDIRSEATKATNAAKEMMDETVEEVIGNKSSPSPQEEQKVTPATDSQSSQNHETASKKESESEKSPTQPMKVTPATDSQSSQKYETASKKESESEKSPPEPMVEFKTGTSNGDVEIVGLRLGMSPSQAEATLKSYNKDFKFRYKNQELYGESRVHQSIHRDHRVIANTKYVSYIMSSADGSTSYSPAKKGEWFVLTFAAPPSQNKLIHIRRVKGFLDTGPTITAYDRAFINKYGDIYFSQGFDKVVRLISEKPIDDSDNKRCFDSIGKSLGHARDHTYDRRARTNSGCGLILASSFEPLDLSMQMVQKITMELADIDEMNLVADRTRKLIEDNNQKIRDDRLKAASKSEAPIF